MLHELYKTDTLDKSGTIVITGDSTSRLLHYEGTFAVTLEGGIGRMKKRTVVHYKPEASEEYVVVSIMRKEPVYGSVSLLDPFKEEKPFGSVIKVGTHAVIKAYNKLSAVVELHYYYRGVCVDVEELERADINTHKNYVSEQQDWGHVPTCPVDITAIINQKAARYLNK